MGRPRAAAAQVSLRRVAVRGLAQGERALDAGVAHHLVTVLRFGVGDAFVAFDPDARVEAGAVLVRTRGKAVARFDAPHAAPPVARSKIAWVHGLAKGDKCDAIARDATELGATRVVFAPCERSVARPKDGAQRLRRWSKIAEEAARQSGRADAPEIALVPSWQEALASCAGARVCLHPGGAERLSPADFPSNGPIAFAAGPEGGLTDQEVAVAARLGWSVRTLGALVLRTETVPAAVLGALIVSRP